MMLQASIKKHAVPSVISCSGEENLVVTYNIFGEILKIIIKDRSIESEMVQTFTRVNEARVEEIIFQ